MSIPTGCPQSPDPARCKGVDAQSDAGELHLDQGGKDFPDTRYLATLWEMVMAVKYVDGMGRMNRTSALAHRH